MEKKIELTNSDFCYRTEHGDIYHVGHSKIHIFSTLEGFITEETCFKLSKVETTRFLLPKPFYQNGEYVGCSTKWKENDWIHAFYAQGTTLRHNLMIMKEEILLLSELGYDIGEMPFYYSNYDQGRLTFDGSFKMSESSLPQNELERKNDYTYQEYLKGLVYNGMSEFETDSYAVSRYLTSSQEQFDKKLEKVLQGRRPAGNLIRDDIEKSRH